jgi:hypothetical protein
MTHRQRPVRSLEWTLVVVSLCATGCPQQFDTLRLLNRAGTEVRVYYGSGPASSQPPANFWALPAGGTEELRFEPTVKWFFRIFADYHASFRVEFREGLSVATPDGRSKHISLAEIERRRTRCEPWRPALEYCEHCWLELDTRDLPP